MNDKENHQNVLGSLSFKFIYFGEGDAVLIWSTAQY